MLLARMEDIIIPNKIAESNPAPEKIEECLQYYKTYGFQDRWIGIDKKGVLYDGYIMYLVLKLFGVKYAEVYRIGGKKLSGRRQARIFKPVTYYGDILTTYVFGVHVNGTDNVERVWRIPMGKICDLDVGDIVMVHANGKIVPIKVTRLLMSDRPPITSVKIKTVCYDGEKSKKVNEDV